MTADSRDLEILVAKIQQQLAPQAEVLHDVRLDGRKSKTKRQIDVLVRQKVGQYEIQIVIDCKDYNKPVDVKGVEEFQGLLRDVGAQRGVLVCPKGFSEAAKARAEGWQIDLYSPIDTDPHKWQARVTMPAICDFRSALISFGISVSAPLPFMLPNKFYETSMIYDGDNQELGTPLSAALAKWNDGVFPAEPGEHHKLNLFESRTVRMDNGYKTLAPVNLYASLYVEQQLYYGPLPIPRISGFLDAFTGKVITNAFSIGLLDPNEIERDWLKINRQMDAPIEPVIVLQGRIAWTQG